MHSIGLRVNGGGTKPPAIWPHDHLISSSLAAQRSTIDRSVYSPLKPNFTRLDGVHHSP